MKKTVEHVIRVKSIYDGGYRNSREVWGEIVERKSENPPYTDWLVAYTSDPTALDTLERAKREKRLVRVTAWEGYSSFHLTSCEEV